MRTLILGGDGYLGWPTALRFSSRGHTVMIVDNLLRRRCHLERGTDSLTPIRSLQTRIRRWHERTGKDILYQVLDITDFSSLGGVISDFQPETIIHFGEMPSAPFSMIDRDHAVQTQVNNVVGTLNVLWAMRQFTPNAHLIKLGTMGEYGTPNIDIEEGYIEIDHNGRRDTLPFPKRPGSFYHLSKVHDSNNIDFACRIWNLRTTDLNQGVVYGIHTDETAMDAALVTRFDYDEHFGTTLNRFCVQAVAGHPLTVYGTGGQTRGFLNIRDTLQCLELAAEAPPDPGHMQVFNQFTETFSVAQLAKAVVEAASHLGLSAEATHIDNPRAEAEEHYYNPRNDKLLALGLHPTLLSEELVQTVLRVVEEYRDRIDRNCIVPTTKWR